MKQRFAIFGDINPKLLSHAGSNIPYFLLLRITEQIGYFSISLPVLFIHDSLPNTSKKYSKCFSRFSSA